MTPGKAVSQGGHAFEDSFVKAERSISLSYLADGATKIALVAPDLPSIQSLYEQALAANVPCALVVEDGHVMPPVFDGSPIVTALGIGPVERCKVRHITKGLPLMA